MKKYYFFLLSSFISYISFAQNASIQGFIQDARTNEKITGATIGVLETGNGAYSDENGNFLIENLEAGTYTLLSSFNDYAIDTLSNVVVKAGEIHQLTIKLKPFQLNVVTIAAQKVTHTETAVITEMKKSEQVIVAVSSQQIAKTQDRTASEVMRRVPGVTIADNRFVMVRGLNERYNSVLLNGVFAPSLEADKKAFSFDMIPSGVLDRLIISKSAAPELPGEFAGGVIKVATKNIPDSNMVNFNYSTSYRCGTTFQSFYVNQQYGSDMLGLGAINRQLPTDFPSKVSSSYASENAALWKSFRALDNHWTAQQGFATPDQRFNFFLGRKFNIKDVQVGNITSVSYTLSNEHFLLHNYNYNAYNIATQRSDTLYNYLDDTYNRSVRLGILHNWAFVLSPKHKIEFRNMFNQIGLNQSIVRTGHNLEEGFEVKSGAYRYQQRSIYTGQLHGEHELNQGNTKVEWTGGFSATNSQEPDYKRVRTVRDIGSNDRYQVVIASSPSNFDAGRFYSNLNEKVVNGGVDVVHKINFSEKFIPILKFGAYTDWKTRTFSARWMSYLKSNISQFDNTLVYKSLDEIFKPENVNATTGFKVGEGTNPSDKYDASNWLMAGYVGTSLPISSKFNISGGARVEFNRQELSSKTYTSQIVKVNNPILSILPSVNATYNLTEKQLIRASYGKTVNRPEFRELAPFAYYDFNFNTLLYGNKDLKIANIHNADLRYELYPTPSELIAIGAYYKRFNNPIETFFIPGTGSRNFTFGNAEHATSMGVETEIRKSFENVTTLPVLSKMSVVMNAAYIYSRVDLGSAAVGQSRQRQMMGQSPYIFNVGVYYNDTDHKFQVAALYNVIGKRLFAVGTVGTPDIYEMPRNVVDLNVSKGFGKHWEIRVGVQDLLNQAIWLQQDSNANGKLDSGDEIINKSRRGTYITTGITLKY